MKSKKVCIKTKSSQAPLLLSLVTIKPTTVKWPIVVISLGTLHLFADKFMVFVLTSPPHPQFNVGFYPSNLATIFQHFFRGQGDSKN